MTLSGTYNGLAFGADGQVAISDAAGLDDMPNLRSSDGDRGDEGLIPGRDSLGGRTVTFTWLLLGGDELGLEELRTAVQRALLPQADQELPMVFSTGRQVNCRPRRMQIPRDFQVAGSQIWAEAIVEFVASDPWCSDAADLTNSFTIGSTPGLFFPAMFPILLAASEVFARPTVTNDGDTIAWPVWTVIGPGSGVTLRNLTTGMMLSLPQTLGSGRQLTIDTRPGTKTVTLDDGTNLFGTLAAGSALWPLARGDNVVSIEMTGADSINTRVSLAYRRRFIGVG